jgi:hypothetical protein
VRLAADANVLLSAVLGGRARDILLHPEVTEIVTENTGIEWYTTAELLKRLGISK